MHIERKIIIGLITSTDYLRQLQKVWNPKLLESSTARRLANWCWEYFERYNHAPSRDIETIYYQKLKDEHLSKEIAKEIEQDILPSLSEEYVQEGIDINYLLDQTFQYFKRRSLLEFSETIRNILEQGKGDEHQRLLQAEQIAVNYQPLTTGVEEGLNLHSERALDKIKQAFEESTECLVRYPRQLGEFWNSQFVRSGFVAFMASIKRGKTFWLLDIAIRACRQKRKVVFIQAGDMTETQQLKRICVYLAQKSNLKRYCGKMWEPVRDCVFNQLNECERKERECNFGIFEGCTVDYLRQEIKLEELIEAYKANPNYVPCSNCYEYELNHWGCPWIKEVDVGDPLTVEEAQRVVREFFIENKRYFKLESYANDTLTVKQIRALLEIWEKQEQFIPDVIVIDYADLLTTEERMEERPKQNKIWKELRRLSQERNRPLIVTATQADARSFEQGRLRPMNFSEDKRKLDHCTAMFALNQDPHEREKKIGLTRINYIAAREGEFYVEDEVYVLQNLKRGRPFLGSFR